MGRMRIEMAEQQRSKVLVFGGSVVGRALELLLRGTDLDVTFLEDPTPDEPRLPEGTRLVIIAPGMDERLRESLMEQARRQADEEHVPILELISGESEELETGHTVLLWPCPLEVLRQGVLDLVSPDRDDDGTATTNP